MGKGDRKSRRGKIFMGSYGVSRPARRKKVSVAKAATAAAPITIEAPEKKKAAPKKKAAAPKKKETES